MTPLVTLDNCDQEPIHIPGLIQPHGALLAFTPMRLLAFASINMAALTGIEPRWDMPMEAQALPSLVIEEISAWFSDQAKIFAWFDVVLNGHKFDVLGHRNDEDFLIVEFERTDDIVETPDASFAMLVHRSMERFKRQTDINDLLGMVATEVRKITGFDRVMAYRFRHDDSGEVVRESRREGLESWEGQRYPSTDLPAQARRLFIANALRLITHVQATPVRLEGSPTAASRPLDMSFCVLRSVSPIHIEYLTNMEVHASLSISIVIEGKLWGMIACHHGAARRVPHGIRMVCEVLAQMIGVSVANLQMNQVAAKLAYATDALGQIGVRARAADDLLTGITSGKPNPGDLVSAEVIVCLWGGRASFCKGMLPPESVARLARALEQQTTEIVANARLTNDSGDLAAAVAPYCGILAVCFDVGKRGWIVWLRAEQIDHVRWAGNPQKQIKLGPNGPRLTPRGSFLEWREEVRGSSMPWELSDLRSVEALRAELSRIAGTHAIEMERARHQLLAALGHDLREPLHSITLAAQVLQARGEQEISTRIAKTSGRMARLVVQILDMSLLQSDMGIVLERSVFDLALLLKEAVDDANFSYPGNDITLIAPSPLMVDADRDRLSQVLSNLLSNARHHGTPGEPVSVSARKGLSNVCFSVKNSGQAIPADVQVDLFKALKPSASMNPRNRTGLGLGLYIASEIMKAHGGDLTLECSDNDIIFKATLPDRK